MATKNDVTGDAIKSKASTDAYRDNYDRIYNWYHKCSALNGKELMLPKRESSCKWCGNVYRK